MSRLATNINCATLDVCNKTLEPGEAVSFKTHTQGMPFNRLSIKLASNENTADLIPTLHPGGE